MVKKKESDYEKDRKNIINKIWKWIPRPLRPCIILGGIILTVCSWLTSFFPTPSITPSETSDNTPLVSQTEELEGQNVISVEVCRELDEDWINSTYIAKGELAKCKISFENTNSFMVQNVSLNCVLTSNLEIVDSLGITIYNSSYPNGYHENGNGFGVNGINIQDYLPSEHADIVFYLKAVSEDIEGQESVTATATVNGFVYQETAWIKVKNPSGGWGDNIGGRREYTIEEINDGTLGNTITFNSISDGKIGHEFNFVGARKMGDPDPWNANLIDVEDEEIYTVRLYFHNNSPLGYDAIAKDVKAYFSLPTTFSKEHTIIGYIDSSNAVPNRYWDGVTLKSDQYFIIEYIVGSARLYNTGIGGNDGVSLTDKIILSQGALIGYNALDGMIPGCYEYDGQVTINVKVHMLRS